MTDKTTVDDLIKRYRKAVVAVANTRADLQVVVDNMFHRHNSEGYSEHDVEVRTEARGAALEELETVMADIVLAFRSEAVGEEFLLEVVIDDDRLTQ